MDLALIEDPLPQASPTPLLSADDLERLPLPGGGSTSLFYADSLLPATSRAPGSIGRALRVTS